MPIELLLFLGYVLSLVTAFAVGYGVRAYKSYVRRSSGYYRGMPSYSRSERSNSLPTSDQLLPNRG